MNWAKIWMDLFGTTALWGVDMGFCAFDERGVLEHETEKGQQMKWNCLSAGKAV